MSMLVNCTRGCGIAIEVSDEMIDDARNRGVPLNVAHDICPNDPRAPKHDFKVTIIVERRVQGATEFETVARFGSGAIQATTFSNVIGDLQDSMNQNWQRVIGMSAMIDSSTPQGEEVPDQPDWERMEHADLEAWARKNNILYDEQPQRQDMIDDLKAIRPENLLRP